MPLNLVRLAPVVAAPSRSPLLFAWIWRLIQRAVCLALHTHSAVAAQPLYRHCCLPDAGAWTWRGCHIQAEFCSRPLAQPRSPLPRVRTRPCRLFERCCSTSDLVTLPRRSAPSLCDARRRRAAPPDIRQRTDGTARHGAARHGAARYGAARHGAARHGTARRGTARHGMERQANNLDILPGIPYS